MQRLMEMDAAMEDTLVLSHPPPAFLLHEVHNLTIVAVFVVGNEQALEFR